MPKAKMHMKDLNLFCPPGKLTLDYQAVVTLVYENSQTNEKYYHAVWVSITLYRSLLPVNIQFPCLIREQVDTFYKVTLKESHRLSNELIMTVIDSQADTSESIIKVRIRGDGTLQIGGKKDQLCLGSSICFFLIL